MVNPGFHSVPAGPEHPDSGAGGTSVTEVLFLDPAALTATIKLSGIGSEPSYYGTKRWLGSGTRRRTWLAK
jgi:hypothetical protein